MKEEEINGHIIYYCDGLWFIEHETGFYVYQSKQEAERAAITESW